MKRPRRSRIILLALTIPQLVLPSSASLAGVFGSPKADADGPITLQQAAAYVDIIDKRLFEEGTIGVKSPDVWGQNRMTVYRAEFESQMATRLGNYQDILQAAQTRNDIATLTSATSLGATVAAAQSKGSTTTTVPKTVVTPTSPIVTNILTSGTPAATTSSGGSSSSAAASGPGNPDFTGLATQLQAISARLDALKSNPLALALPTNINTFNNKPGNGVGIEPTVQLDEESDFVNHLHKLRRVNAGDDNTDMAGYGLYLMRMPVSLMPGPQSRKGKGAVVTVEARHELTDDLLPNTYRDVAILDLTYVLTQIVNEDIHRIIFNKCHQPIIPVGPQTSTNRQTDPPKNIPGPSPSLIEDFRAILGPIDPPAPASSGGVDAVPPPPHGHGSAFHPAYPAGAFKPSQQPKGSVPPTLPPLPLATPTLARAKPAGSGPIAKRDEVVKTQFYTVFHTKQDETDYRTTGSNRLGQLVRSMEAAQCDPFRHDPSTLTLFQTALMDVYKYMRENAARVDLFQVPKIEALGERLIRRDYKQLRLDREQFLRELYCFRRGLAVNEILPASWSNEVEPSDILAFALLLQFVNVDRQLKWDMRYMSQRRDFRYGDVDGLFFYEFEPSMEARQAFKEYVACKWPLRIYSVDPVLDQQNVLDAYSRRTELQLALAVAVSTGQFNIKNATTFARQLDLDLQTVGLNRTSVGFGAGETTFGWMFYPRVQTPQPFSNFRTFTNLLTGTGGGINTDLRSRRIEPGQRECVAMIVTPNFIPSLKVSTVTNWFDLTGFHAKQRLNNQEMLELSRMLQQAKAAVMRACDSHQYRATDFTVLNQRIKQLEALLPTQDTRVDLPDEGDLLGSEIFSSNASGLSPALLAWYGESVQDGTAGSIFLQGRGFSVSETQVVVGGIPLHKDTEFRLISRNVMQIIVPANARSLKVQCDQDNIASAASKAPAVAVATINTPGGDPILEVRGGVADLELGVNQRVQAQLDPTLNSDVNVTLKGATTTSNARGAKVDILHEGIRLRAEGTPAAPTPAPAKPCDRAVMDVHIATPNGISNHLYVEVVPKTPPVMPKNAVTTATTTQTVQGNTTTTTTKFETTPPGTVLPQLTVLPMGTTWPPASVLSPGAVTGAPAGSLLPGMVPTAPTPTPTPLSLTPAATPATTAAAAANSTNTTVPPAAPAPATTTTPATSSVSPIPPVGGMDGQVEVAASTSPAPSDLPPLPTDPPKVAAAPVAAKAPAPRTVRPSILRRIGLPDR